jgi:hypothetical protein
VDTVGAGLQATLIADRLDLEIDYSFSTATGNIGTRPLGTPTVANFSAVDYPDTENSLNALNVTLNYHVTERLTTRFRYTFEEYKETDFAVDDIKPYMEDVDGGASRSVFLGAYQPAYKAQWISFSFDLTF